MESQTQPIRRTDKTHTHTCTHTFTLISVLAQEGLKSIEMIKLGRDGDEESMNESSKGTKLFNQTPHPFSGRG